VYPGFKFIRFDIGAKTAIHRLDRFQFLLSLGFADICRKTGMLDSFGWIDQSALVAGW
jgi:hypothetical protein